MGAPRQAANASVLPADLPADISAICWFRRDLRLRDNGALAAALAHVRAHGGRVLCAFVFDADILDGLPDRDDRRVSFIAASVAELHATLARSGGGLLVLHGRSREEIPRLAARFGRVPVFASADRDPASMAREAHVRQELSQSGSSLAVCEDHVVVATDALSTGSSQPYRVFTPYFRSWMAALERDPEAWLAERASSRIEGLVADPGIGCPGGDLLLERIGFRTAGALVVAPGEAAAREALARFLPRLDDYGTDRDLPAVDGTSALSPHLRFGTISARELVRAARESRSPGASKWISEIAWRDFYQMVLRHFPGSVDHAFQTRLENVAWDDPVTDSVAKDRFDAWKEGRTGYPFVDAAMRELRATGWMHNRCRMAVASFLTKDLHIHWKRGERWFARWLLDIELASNVGGWQWSAGTGADAQPWFRIFNPVEQGKRWDPDGAWTRRWCPELSVLPSRWVHAPWTAPAAELDRAGIRLGRDWPRPVVDHAIERAATLERFGRASG